MEKMHGSKFKFIYTDWFIQNGERKPFGNAIHPIIREFIQHIHKNNLNIDYYKILQYGEREKGIKFDHSELINYLYRNFPKNIISSNQIQDDDFTYIYPLEIKDTLVFNDLLTANIIGAVGYIIHVGKSTTGTIQESLLIMKNKERFNKN